MKRYIVVSYILALFSIVASFSFDKTHNILLVKMDKPEPNKDWVEDCRFEFKKMDNGIKVLSLNLTAKKKLDGPDILCAMKMFQKSSSKYLKSPWDFPEKSCCEFMEQYEVGWQCVQKRSSFPERCPFLEGQHWIKDFSVEDCNYPSVMPPNMPEDYKVEVNVNKKGLSLLKLTVYIKIKKRMSFF